MNEKLIAFIICTNNINYYQECIRYIQDLEIPEGYETDIICVQEADSMTQGYNGGMQATKAKYKVYLHQDTFILNPFFIYDILKIFQNDNQIGMIGVIGCNELPENAACYLKWNVGCVDAYNGQNTLYIELQQNPENMYTQVEAIDGLIMITQYDVKWREDILDGWDFYDVSQSLEMQNCGYRVVVPYQKTPWCYHDCGVSKLQKYDFYREKIIQAYPERFCGKVDAEEKKKEQRQLDEAEQIQKRLIKLVEMGAYSEIEKNAEELEKIYKLGTQAYEIINLSRIYGLEKNSISGVQSKCFSITKWSELREYFTKIRWILIRIAYNKNDERIGELQEAYEKGILSKEALEIIFLSISNKGIETLEQSLNMITKTKSDKSDIAYCIPTYNHPETVEAVLNQVGNLYKSFDVDIYVYDSSPNDLTCQVVNKMISQGLTNLYYVRVDDDISYDEKLILIFSEYGMKKKYKYIWPVKDRTVFEEITLVEIIKNIEFDFDVIFLRTATYPDKFDDKVGSDIIYYNAKDFYSKEGWLATSLHPILYNVEKMLKNIDWDMFRKLYFFNGESQFDHFAVLFHQLAIKDTYAVKVIGLEKARCFDFAKSKSMWVREAFHVWGELWPMTNDALPDYYEEYKDEVIKKVTSLPWLLGSVEMLVILKEQGVLTMDTYNNIKNCWERVSNISSDMLKYIVGSSIEELKNLKDGFWNKANIMLASKKYEELCNLICQYSWIKIYDENEKFCVLEDCMMIFFQELKSKSSKNIFADSSSVDSAIDKVMGVKKRFCKNSQANEEETMLETVQYVAQNKISAECIMYIITKYCTDKENILEEFIKYCTMER